MANVWRQAPSGRIEVSALIRKQAGTKPLATLFFEEQMATISYTFVDRCAGGGHTRFDISINNGVAQRITYQTDDIRSPLSELSDDQQDLLKLLILKVHMAGKTRPQIAAELNSPVVVTI